MFVSVDCENGQDMSYELFYNSSSGTSITTCVVNGTDCSDGVCRHEVQNNTADSRCQPPVPQFNGGSVILTMTTRNIGYNVTRTISELYIVYNSCKNEVIIKN